MFLELDGGGHRLIRHRAHKRTTALNWPDLKNPSVLSRGPRDLQRLRYPAKEKLSTQLLLAV